MKSRKERDSLGSIEVPSEALYGARTQRIVETSTVGGKKLSQYPNLVRALAQVKKAAAIANKEAGVLENIEARTIAKACDAVIAGEHAHEFVVDVLHGGGSIGFNTNMNEVLAKLSGVASDRINASQSTADVVQSAGHLAILAQQELLLTSLRELEKEFQAKSKEFADIETLARTCLQDAMPVSLGAHMGSYVSLLRRRREELSCRSESLLSINLGGTVIGTGEGTPAAYRRTIIHEVARISKRKVVASKNLLDAAQNLDSLSDLASNLSTLSVALVKIAQDFRLLSSGPQGGFGEITLPAVQEGSSFFPGKINPSVPETLMQSCWQAHAQLSLVDVCLAHGDTNLNVFEGLATVNILDALWLLSNAMSLFARLCVAGTKANRKRCRVLAETRKREKSKK